MTIYENRYDDAYLNVLRKKLAIDGPEGLLQKAVKITKPKRRDGKNYTHCCRIDFSGVAATNLLRMGDNVGHTNAAESLEHIFQNAEELNRHNCFVKMRFLFVYPYSSYAFARIQAASTRDRSSMDQPQYGRDLRLIKQVDKETFTQSILLRSIQNSLEQLQILGEKYDWTSSSLNQLVIRFTPVSPNLCTLFINDSAFSDPYLLAKQSPESKFLALAAPLVHIERSLSENTFKAFDDHFRYLWELDTTIDSEDATEYQHGKPDTLRTFKVPQNVVYNKKAERIKQKNPSLSDKEIHDWKFLVKKLLLRSCSDTQPTPNSESIFVACSWEEDKNKRMLPNPDARGLVEWLNKDFGIQSRSPIFSVQIMEAAIGGFLTKQLFTRLNQSTLAVIILTCDIEGEDGEWYSKPNVYHELGYLFQQLGEERMVIICEENVHIPSNISDFVPIKFRRGQLFRCYSEILAWLKKATYINTQLLEVCVERHIEYLKELLSNNVISLEEFDAGQKHLKDLLRENAAS